MRTIRYLYSSTSKQIFLFVLIFSMLVRMALFFEIKYFKIGEYSEYYNSVATIILYLGFILICFFLLVAYKFFYTEFTEFTVTKVNHLFRKQKTINLNQIHYVNFDNRGINLFENRDDKKPIMLIPFYKFGIVSPVGVESFEKLCAYKKIPYDINYKALPGRSPLSKIFSILFVILSFILVINALQILLLVIMVLTKGQ